MLKFGFKSVIASCCLLAASGMSECKAQVVPLPSVPDSLRTPSARAAYISQHFWDVADFGDSVLMSDRVGLEQAFADFLTVLSIAAPNERKVAVGTLMQKAALYEPAEKLFMNLAEKYLYEPDSPMASDEIYLLFLDEILDAPSLSEEYKLRPRAQRLTLQRTLPGQVAPDFGFLTREGREMALSDVRAGGEILLMFYDPDCSHCMETIERMTRDEALAAAIAGGSRTVVAVYSGDDKALWEATAHTLPVQWIVGYEDGTVQDEDIYVIRTLPTLLRLSPERVILPADSALVAEP